MVYLKNKLPAGTLSVCLFLGLKLFRNVVWRSEGRLLILLGNRSEVSFNWETPFCWVTVILDLTTSSETRPAQKRWPVV